MGDLSYADGYYSRWDSFGRMVEALAAQVPLMVTGGNHEVGTAEAWLSYNARYPMPHAASGSPSNLWWSRDVGPAHVISLCSYCGSGRAYLQFRGLAHQALANQSPIDHQLTTHQPPIRHASLQFRWLMRDLASLDRDQAAPAACELQATQATQVAQVASRKSQVTQVASRKSRVASDEPKRRAVCRRATARPHLPTAARSRAAGLRAARRLRARRPPPRRTARRSP